MCTILEGEGGGGSHIPDDPLLGTSPVKDYSRLVLFLTYFERSSAIFNILTTVELKFDNVSCIYVLNLLAI